MPSPPEILGKDAQPFVKIDARICHKHNSSALQRIVNH
jgi:hypothetical protein